MKEMTIIVSAYNRPKRLERALKSVFSQSIRGKLDIFVCDNGSPGKGQQNLLKKIEDRGVHVLRGPVEEPSQRALYCPMATMINRALDLVETPFVRYLLDSDMYTERSCEVLLDALTSGKGDLVWGQVLPLVGGKVGNAGPFASLGHNKIAEDLPRFNFINHNSAAHRSGLVRWDTRAEAWKKADWLFWLRLLRAGYTFANIGDPVEIYDWAGRMGATREKKQQTIEESLGARA